MKLTDEEKYELKQIKNNHKADRSKANKEEILKNREWYCLNSMISYWWAIFLFLLGGREAGKSYAVTDFYCKQYKKYHRPFTWFRLTETSARKLLANNAEKLVDPDLKRKYNLDLITNGNDVYEVKRDKKGKIIKGSKKLFAQVFGLNTFYNAKGEGLFDKDFLNNPKMYYNICLDEMNREMGEKNSFDIVYSFVNMLENKVRSTKTKIRVICIGNTLENASDILCAFNFIPENFGRFKLVKNKKKLMEYIKEYNANIGNPQKIKEIDNKYKDIDFGKRAVIEYIEPNEAYKTRRKGTISDIITPEASTFTNEIKIDASLVNKKRLLKPVKIIKFTKNKDSWFTVWDDNIIKKYNNEKCDVIAMRPYIDEKYIPSLSQNVIDSFDLRYFEYHDLITFKIFQKNVNLLKPRGAKTNN